jgi:catechol 2,3-dioxygenase-like lactoylglutathione lyase family enzyme
MTFDIINKRIFLLVNCIPLKARFKKPLSSLPLSFTLLNLFNMVTKLSHTSFFVTDQEKAYDFYVNKLGFKVHTDVKMDNGMRWLTLNPPEQPDLEIVLIDGSGNGSGMGWDAETQQALKILLQKDAMGAGVLHTPDCRATYEELKAKGVHFKSEPKEQFYGTECIITDGCGNWFSMTQPKEM